MAVWDEKIPGVVTIRQAFVDEKLSRVQRSLEEASEEERSNLEREWLGSVRDRQHRWDLKLSLSPCVWDALQEVVQNLHPFLEGAWERPQEDPHLEGTGLPSN